MPQPGHFVAIIGGAVSGAEAAFQLSKRGITSVVIDQYALPYGKIEDGLPKWHIKLRNQEEAKIDEKLTNPFVHFLPNTRLGRDVSFQELIEEWGVSAVLLATGAWRDRPLPVEGIDAFIGKGLYYQNPLIYWFNHCHEPTFHGPHFELTDGAIVVGGGLASLDVMKVLMMDQVGKALEARGIQGDIFTLDRSIQAVLEANNLTLDDLGIKPPTLFYRRGVEDMPLSPFPPTTPEKLEKAKKVRRKILNNYQRKYLFEVETYQVPVDKIVENGRLAGLTFQQTRVEDGKVIPIPGTEKSFRSPLVISSIGSIPEQINGIPLAGQVFNIADPETCRIEGFPHVFALGNAVTGRGNINESLRHGREISHAVITEYFDEREEMYRETFRTTENSVKEHLTKVVDQLSHSPLLTQEKMEALSLRVKNLQQKVGYDGDYETWVKNHLPMRLEELIGFGH